MRIPEITDDELVFGTTKALPAYAKIPAEFKRMDGTKWNRLVSNWFFSGLASLKVTPKEGVDKEKALRAISAHLKSWKPKHEHKEAGVAYMMSQWFDDAEWETRNRA